MDDLEERVRSLAEPVLARYDAELVDVVVRRGRTQLVRVVADRPDGIDLDTCAEVSRELSRMLDLEDPVPGRYMLEVSSPGLDRPLRTEQDFRRNIGRKVRIVLAAGQHEGIVEEVGADQVVIRTHRDERQEVAFAEIVKGKIVLPW